MLDDASVETMQKVLRENQAAQEGGATVDMDDPVVSALLRALVQRSQYLNEIGLDYLIMRLKQAYGETDFNQEWKDKINAAATNTQLQNVKNELLQMINDVETMEYLVVSELPSTGKKGVIYLLRLTAWTTTKNLYEEYVWVNDRYELLGTMDVGSSEGPFVTEETVREIVESIVGSSTPAGGYVKKTGDTMTGDLTFDGTRGVILNSETAGAIWSDGNLNINCSAGGLYLSGNTVKIRNIGGSYVNRNLISLITIGGTDVYATDYGIANITTAINNLIDAAINSGSGGSSGDYLPIAGGTITGNLRLKGSGSFGNVLNFGDGDYVHISEPTDDVMELKGSTIRLLTATLTQQKGSTGSYYIPITFTLNNTSYQADNNGNVNFGTVSGGSSGGLTSLTITLNGSSYTAS